MPWIATDQNPECPDWAVVKEEDLSLVACHDTEEQALAQIAALNAEEAAAAGAEAPVAASAVLSSRAADALSTLLDYHRRARVAAVVAVEDEIPVVDEAAVEEVADETEAETAAPSGLIAVAIPTDPASIAVEGGLPPEELHVTLGYFGDALAAPPELTDALHSWLTEMSMQPFTARVSGVAIMGEEDPPATALLLEATEFSDLRATIEGVAGQWLDMEHPHFTPHMTLGYGIPVPSPLP
jgi:hypothetical protein